MVDFAAPVMHSLIFLCNKYIHTYTVLVHKCYRKGYFQGLKFFFKTKTLYYKLHFFFVLSQGYSTFMCYYELVVNKSLVITLTLL